MTFRARYLSADPELMSLYSGPATLESLQKAAKARSQVSIDRRLLTRVIRRQYGQDIPAPVLHNIALLESEGTFTITTGQQVGLLGGPLYAIYKTITTIALARKAGHRLGSPVVPVFWMATEDHDAEEVDHFFTGFDQCWEYTGHISGAVGRHRLTEKITSVLERAGVQGYGKWFKPGLPWAEAFRSLWRYLFDHEGLIILDPDDPELKKAIRPVIQADLLLKAGFEGVSEATAALSNLRIAGQVAARDPNFFILEDGQRKKVTRRSDQLFIGMEQHPVSQLAFLDRLETSPEDFSPNVVLRPLYQESVLPDLAYVGGWAEIAYWGQFKGVFERCGIPMPLIWPRMSASVFFRDDLDELQKLGFTVQDLDRTYDDLRFTLAEKKFGNTELREQLLDIEKKMSTMAAKLGMEHPTLERSMTGWEKRTQHFFEHLERRRLKLLMSSNPQLFRTLDRLKQRYKPDGKLQERIWSIAAIAPSDPFAIVQQIIAGASPLSPDHQWIIL